MRFFRKNKAETTTPGEEASVEVDLSALLLNSAINPETNKLATNNVRALVRMLAPTIQTRATERLGLSVDAAPEPLTEEKIERAQKLVKELGRHKTFQNATDSPFRSDAAVEAFNAVFEERGVTPTIYDRSINVDGLEPLSESVLPELELKAPAAPQGEEIAEKDIVAHRREVLRIEAANLGGALVIKNLTDMIEKSLLREDI